MKLYADEEVRDLLLYYGYNVPMIVIRTWGKSCNRRGRNRRCIVESWLRYRQNENHGHYSPFPQFLTAFQITMEDIYAKFRPSDKRPVQGATLQPYRIGRLE